MHVLYFPSWYSTKSHPLRGVFFKEQALAMQKAGYQVGILQHIYFGPLDVIRQRAWKALFPRIAPWQDETMPVYTATQIKMFLQASRPYLNAMLQLAERAFARYCADWGMPDLLHGQAALYGGYTAVKIGRRYRLPVVLTEHASIYLRAKVNPAQGQATRETLQAADRCLAVSPALASALQPYAPRRTIEILPNTVDGRYFHPVPCKPPPPFQFLVVASLDPNKGVDLILKGLARAFLGQDVHLKIAGEGRMKKALVKLTHDLNLSQQVEFMGQMPRERIRDLMQASHAVVLASYKETFGMVLIEALACGKPVISTRSGGPDSIVTAENGLLVSPGSVEELSQAMEQIVRHYSSYDPYQIHKKCIEQYGNEAFVQKLDKIYQELVKK